MVNIRVGFGYDMHRLQRGRELWLGGVKVDWEYGLMGHSDADVLIHAITDALLGAANLRDIGFHFPNNSPDYKDISSVKLLKKVMELLREKGFSIGNVDSTICAEQPKLNPYISEMKYILSSAMGVGEDAVSIKATTSEKMGFVGREEGVSAYAVVLIYTS